MTERLVKKLAELKANKKKGFTLIELVVVIVIIAILALIMVPNITSYIARSENSKAEANLRSMYTNAQLVIQAENIGIDEEDEFAAAVGEYSNMAADDVEKDYEFAVDADGKLTVTHKETGKTFDGSAFGEVGEVEAP